jgi:uncharacterized protein
MNAADTPHSLLAPAGGLLGKQTTDYASADRKSLAAEFHLFDTEYGAHVLVVDGSQIFAIDKELTATLKAAFIGRMSETRARDLLADRRLGLVRFMGQSFIEDPPLRALSLAVAQRCNLGCAYCYAEGGSFGSATREMPWSVAKSSLRRLFSDARQGERVNLAFLGGEPLVNRRLVRRTTELAARFGASKRVPIGFSITTNGTLLNSDDCEFFERYGFAVTVSLDGVGPAHDRLRPTKGGVGTYERIITNVCPFLGRQRRMQVTARVTVTPENLGLREALDHFISLGFHSVGFSPMLRSPSRQNEMAAQDLDTFLGEMIACGREFERRIVAGEHYPFANMMTALQEIHRGTHRPYPCGAGAGYFGVSSSGGLFACHRFVEDMGAALGHTSHGVDRGAQRKWLAERAVDRQEPCRSCWARYLCGGGCHYEVIHRGRPACDYIRGWLEYVMGAYVRLSEQRPDMFSTEHSDGL